MAVHSPGSCTMWWRLLWVLALFSDYALCTCAHQLLGGKLFISLDCGGVAPDFFDQSVPNITWQSDQAFVSTGLSKQIEQQPGGSSQTPPQLLSLRYFAPDSSPAKNCYSFPVQLGIAYLIRAGFLYGNYDGLLSPTIQFQISLDTTPWEDVTIPGSSSSPVYFEVVTAPSAQEQLRVCVIRTGSTSAFINTLELREIGRNGYTNLFEKPVHLRLASRVNFGEREIKSPMRFPHDPYDRFWVTDADVFPNPGGTPYQAPASLLLTVDRTPNNTDGIPNAVARTCCTGPSLTYSRRVLPNVGMYAWTYWVDLNGTVGSNDSRVMDWSDNLGAFDTFTRGENFGPFGLAWRGYLQQNTGASGIYTVTGTRGAASTMDVIVNADELYYVQDLVLGTKEQDVTALAELKTRFNLTHWVGDPCLPVAWDEISCSTTGETRVTSLNLSGKNLSGLIPAAIINELSVLASLNLSKNGFAWEIPDALASLTSLSVLDLSKNELTGSLGSWMESLKKLDVSDNQLDGTFPSSLLRSPGFRYSGNPQLRCLQVDNVACEASLPPPPTASPPSTQNATSESGSGTPVGAIAGGIATVLALTALIGFAVWCCKSRRRYKHMTGDDESSTTQTLSIPGAQAAAFSKDDVRRATENYAHKLGGGGFGPVYYGLLDTRKVEVAVKILSGRSSQGSNEFFNEVALLSTIHHKNLVSLVGYCHEPPDLVLLYEYMPGGDLRERLYGRNAIPPLTWLQRLNIARDTATGLHYLHNGCKRGIIHRDIKSSNILLNKNMEASLADFGLSKLKNEDSGTDQVMTRVQGTPGYLDPEYRTTGFLTEKSDIYSFGVVLMEILSGQPVFAAQESVPILEDRYIVHRVQNAVNADTLNKIVDPALGSNYTRETARSLADIALRCTILKGAARPNIEWVLKELTKTVEKEDIHTMNRMVSFTSDMHAFSSHLKPR